MTISYATRRSGSGVFLVLALLAGMVCSWMATQIPAQLRGAEFIVGAAALLWFSLAGLLWLTLSDPLRLTSGRFDDEAKCFVLTAADGATSAIPYCELASFDLRCIETSGKHKTISFVVYVLKRDGGFWDLESFGDQIRASEMVSRLRNTVSLATEPAKDAEEMPPLPPAFTREEAGGVTALTWRNQDPLGHSLCSALLGSSLAVLPFGMLGVMTEAPTFFELLAAVVVALIARHFYRSSGRVFQLEIGRRFLTYSTRDRAAQLFQVKRVLSLDQVTRLQSTFHIQRALQERSHQLTLVGEQDALRLQDRRFERRQRPQSSSDSRDLDQSIIELDLPGVRTSDVLKFEAYLQAELARHGQRVA